MTLHLDLGARKTLYSVSSSSPIIEGNRLVNQVVNTSLLYVQFSPEWELNLGLMAIPPERVPEPQTSKGTSHRRPGMSDMSQHGSPIPVFYM